MQYFQEMWTLALDGELRGIWFWAAVYTMVVCLYSLIFQVRTRTWPSTEGELSSLSVKKFGATDPILSDQDYKSTALYQYEVDGVSLEGTKVSPWVFVTSHNARVILEKQMKSIQHLPDGKVKVFYNPRKPKKSFLIVAGRVGIAVTIAIAVLPLIGYTLRFHS